MMAKETEQYGESTSSDPTFYIFPGGWTSYETQSLKLVINIDMLVNIPQSAFGALAVSEVTGLWSICSANDCQSQSLLATWESHWSARLQTT